MVVPFLETVMLIEAISGVRETEPAPMILMVLTEQQLACAREPTMRRLDKRRKQIGFMDEI